MLLLPLLELSVRDRAFARYVSKPRACKPFVLSGWWGILLLLKHFGARNTPRQLQPDLPAAGDLLTLLSRINRCSKPDPHSVVTRLCRWRDGVMEVPNIDLLATLCYLSRSGRRYQRQPGGGRQTAPDIWSGRGRYSSELKKMKSVTSFHRGISFAIVGGPSAGVLAFKHLPDTVTAGRICSLLIGCAISHGWQRPAGGMSYGRLIWPLPNGVELFLSAVGNARTQQCTGVEDLLRWNNPAPGAGYSPDVFILSPGIT